MRVTSVSVDITDENGHSRTEYFSKTDPGPVEEFFDFLLQSGIYSNIKATQEWDTPTRVMDRMKGGG